MSRARQLPQQGSSTACFGEWALEAWLGCLPQGYSADVARISECLPDIMTQVLECSPQHNVDDVRELFDTPYVGAEAIFVRLLRPSGGRVHFLKFWKAFGEVACLAGARPSEGVHSEIETLRDHLLRRAEEEPAPGCSMAPVDEWDVGGVGFGALLDEVHRAAAMSLSPRFWQRAAASLSDRPPLERISLDELAGALLAWVSEAAFERPSREQRTAAAAVSFDAGCFGGLVAGGSCASDCAVTVDDDDAGGGLPVLLHIYDVSYHEGIQRLNRVLAFEHSSLKFGGVFHAGVEVNGLEWSFSYSPSRTRPGVSCITPMKHPHHHYRETVLCGHTHLAFARICRIISDMLEEYPGQDYHLLRRNCCHFADDLVVRLGLPGIPGWVHRLSRLGANIDSAIRAAQAVRDAVAVGCIGGVAEQQRGRRGRAQRSHRMAYTKVAARRGAEPVAVPWHVAACRSPEADAPPEAPPDPDRDLGVFGRLAVASGSMSATAAVAPQPPRSSAPRWPPAPSAGRPQRLGADRRRAHELRTEFC